MKVLAIALDALEKDLLFEWAEEGLLPNTQRLLSTSAYAITEAPVAMPAGAVWPSFATATSPARHGRHTNRQIRVGTYETHRLLEQDLTVPPFWVAIGRAGGHTFVLDMPETPLMSTAGSIQIKGWTAHEADFGFEVWPRDLERDIVRRFGRNEIGLCDHLILEDAESIAVFRARLIADVERKVALSRHFAALRDWDLFLVSFGEGHCAGHRCWHLHDPSHRQYSSDQAKQLGNPLRDVYQALDRAIGELIDLAGPETMLFVLSSHGMGPNYNGDHLIDDILAALGHCRAPVDPGSFWQALRWGWRHTPWSLRDRLTPLQKIAVDSIWPSYDSQSNCFKVGNAEVWGAIRVNLAGREPRGRIRPGDDYEAFCAELARDFLALVNVDTGRPAVMRVERASALYKGPKLDELPDLFIKWDNEAPLRAVRSPKTGTLRREYVGPRTGHHREEGVLFATGPGIRPGRLAERVPIVDVGPTLSACLDVRIDGVEGRPIEAMLPGRARVRMSG